MDTTQHENQDLEKQVPQKHPIVEQDWENRNARWDSTNRVLHFKRCPRAFLKTDMPAKKPRSDCPFLSRVGICDCILPSGIRYMSEKNKELNLFDKMRCYLDNVRR